MLSQDELSSNTTFSILLESTVLVINLLFLLSWLYRIALVTFRLHIQRLRSLKICLWLNFVDIKDYEEDLRNIVNEGK